MNNDIDQFIQDLQRQDAAPKTVIAYRSDLSLFGRWFEGTEGKAFSAQEITPTDIRDYKAFLQTRGNKPATINRKLSALKRFFAWAQGRRLVVDSPTSSVKGVASSERAVKWLEKREADKLIRQVERGGKKRDIAIVQLLRHTGLRVSELCSLQLSDLTMGDRSGQVVVRSGKGRKYRTVPLNVTVRAALREYLDVRPDVGSEQLFLSQERRQIATNTVWALIGKYAYQAGLPEATPHTLRHTFAKQLRNEGVDLEVVSRLLGHSRLETTAIYTQPSAQDLERAVEKLDWQ